MIKLTIFAALALGVAVPAMAQNAEVGFPVEPASADDFRLPPEPIIPAQVAGPVDQRLGDDRPFLSKVGPRKHAAHIVTAALDVYSTYRCSTKKRTCQEGNPAVRAIVGKRMSGGEAVLAFAAMEAVYLGGSYLLGETTGYDSSATNIFQVSLIGAHGVAAGLNFRY